MYEVMYGIFENLISRQTIVNFGPKYCLDPDFGLFSDIELAIFPFEIKISKILCIPPELQNDTSQFAFYCF